jgi:hypothetical protein
MGKKEPTNIFDCVPTQEDQREALAEWFFTSVGNTDYTFTRWPAGPKVQLASVKVNDNALSILQIEGNRVFVGGFPLFRYKSEMRGAYLSYNTLRDELEYFYDPRFDRPLSNTLGGKAVEMSKIKSANWQIKLFNQRLIEDHLEKDAKVFGKGWKK